MPAPQGTTDPTRRLLKIFGVKVTDYEERTTALLQRLAATPVEQKDELLQRAVEVVELTADLNTYLREMTNHVLERQARVLSELKAALARGES